MAVCILQRCVSAEIHLRIDAGAVTPVVAVCRERAH